MQKSDLDQIGKVVRKIVREEVVSEVEDAKSTLNHEIRMSRMQVQNDINKVSDRVNNLDIKLNNKMDKVRKDILKKLEIVSHALDKQTMEVGKRVIRIENHLGLSDNN